MKKICNNSGKSVERSVKKKRIRTGLAICLCLSLLLAGCGGGGAAGSSGAPANPKSGSQPAGVSDVLAEGVEEEDRKADAAGQTGADGADKAQASSASDPVPAGNAGSASGTASQGRQSGLNADAPAPEASEAEDLFAAAGQTEGIDVDLTALSSTLVYSEVYNMMAAPDKYIGKTVRMEGTYVYYHDEKSGNTYYACIVKDATACCSQGIEFVLGDEYKYPDDYPEGGTDITVTGVFDTYEEGDFTYCTLRDAKLM